MSFFQTVNSFSVRKFISSHSGADLWLSRRWQLAFVMIITWTFVPIAVASMPVRPASGLFNPIYIDSSSTLASRLVTNLETILADQCAYRGIALNYQTLFKSRKIPQRWTLVCRFPFLTRSLKHLNVQLKRDQNRAWEAPPDWNEYTLRSGYWDIVPFYSDSNAAISAYTKTVIRLVFLRHLIQRNVRSLVPVFKTWAPNPADTTNQKILPLIQSYFSSPLEFLKRTNYLMQMSCLSTQTECLATKKAYESWMITLSRPYYLSGAHFKALLSRPKVQLDDYRFGQLQAVLKMDSVFSRINRLSERQLAALTFHPADADSPNARLFKTYFFDMSQQTSRPKSLIRLNMIRLWMNVVALNDFLNGYSQFKSEADQFGNDNQLSSLGRSFGSFSQLKPLKEKILLQLADLIGSFDIYFNRVNAGLGIGVGISK